VTPAGPPSKRPRPYHKSGVFGLQKRLKEKGLRALDGRSSLARSISAWRSEVEADLGGPAELSRAEHTVLDMAAAAAVMLHQIDAWVGAHPGLLVNSRRRSVAPIVRERIAVAAHLKDLLGTLGLKRRVREVPSLAKYLAARVTPGATPACVATTGPPAPSIVARGDAAAAGEAEQGGDHAQGADPDGQPPPGGLRGAPGVPARSTEAIP
jgi:hypothetical protein